MTTVQFYLTLATIISICFYSLNAQNIAFERLYGDWHSDQTGYSVKQTTDGGYVMVGGNDIFKTNAYGVETWTKPFAGDGRWVEEVDNAYVFCGTRGDNIYVEKRDTAGNLLWNRSYGTQATGNFGYSIRQTHDNGYIITGYIDSLNSVKGMHLMKTDSAGNMLWEKVYESGMDEKGFSVQETADSGFIVTGHSEWSNTEFTAIFKTDQYGNTEWTTSVVGACRDIIQTVDGGYVAVGDIAQTYGNYNDIYILKLNASGQTQWDNTLGTYALDEIANAIVQTQDGSYVISGTTREQQGQASFYYTKAIMLKIDSSGNSVWQKHYTDTQLEQSYGYDIEICSDGGFSLLGSHRFNNANTFEFYMIKTNHLGDVDTTVITNIQEPLTKTESNIFPNPMTDRTNIQLDNREDKIKLINIYDISGKVVRTEQGNNTYRHTIQKQNLTKGQYFIEVITNNGISKKIIWIK